MSEEKKAVLVEVHCHSCDWHGYGDPADPCYDCGEYESLREVEDEDRED